MQQDLSKPTIATIKRLFAHSGNRCAFPKCRVPIIDGVTVMGKVCHIKAAKPGGPRFDSSQTAFDRHGFENLILLCPNHHQIVDDDVEAYTVERLVKMKADSERGATIADDATAEQSAILLVNNNVTTINQTGGIAATTVNQTFNVHQPKGGNTSRVSAAIEKLWQAAIAIDREFNEVMLVDTILKGEEIDQIIKGDDSFKEFGEIVRKYSNLSYVNQKMMKFANDETEEQKIFVPKNIWILFFTHRAIIMRHAYSLHLSFKEGAYRDWRRDDFFKQIVLAVVSPADFEVYRQYVIGGLRGLLNFIEEVWRREVQKLDLA